MIILVTNSIYLMQLFFLVFLDSDHSIDQSKFDRFFSIVSVSMKDIIQHATLLILMIKLPSTGKSGFD